MRKPMLALTLLTLAGPAGAATKPPPIGHFDRKDYYGRLTPAERVLLREHRGVLLRVGSNRFDRFFPNLSHVTTGFTAVINGSGKNYGEVNAFFADRTHLQDYLKASGTFPLWKYMIPSSPRCCDKTVGATAATAPGTAQYVWYSTGVDSRGGKSEGWYLPKVAAYLNARNSNANAARPSWAQSEFSPLQPAQAPAGAVPPPAPKSGQAYFSWGDRAGEVYVAP